MFDVVEKKKRQTDRDPEERERKEGRKTAKEEKKEKKKKKKRKGTILFRSAFPTFCVKNKSVRLKYSL